MAGADNASGSAARPLRTGIADRGPAARPLRVGIAGGGLIAQLVHLPLLAAMEDRFAPAGLADPSRVVRERLAARYRIPAAVAHHAELLELGLDALVVCAPNAAHARIVLDALDAGVHVLVEKPLCLRLDDASRIAGRAEAAGLVVQVGYMKRHTTAYGVLARELRDVPLRLVTSVTVDPGLPRAFTPRGFVAPTDVPVAAGARLEAEATEQVAAAIGSDDPDHVAAFSDAFLGALVHDVNAVHGLIGAGGRVLDGFAAPRAAGAGGTVELPAGGRWTMAWLRSEGAGRFGEELRLYGDDGRWALSFPAPYLRQAPIECSAERETGAGGWERRTESSYDDAYALQLEHFYDCVVHGAACATPAAQAVADIDLLTRLCRAAYGLSAGASNAASGCEVPA